jgi:hypothetical protein
VSHADHLTHVSHTAGESYVADVVDVDPVVLMAHPLFMRFRGPRRIVCGEELEPIFCTSFTTFSL